MKTDIFKTIFALGAAFLLFGCQVNGENSSLGSADTQLGGAGSVNSNADQINADYASGFSCRSGRRSCSIPEQVSERSGSKSAKGEIASILRTNQFFGLRIGQSFSGDGRYKDADVSTCKGLNKKHYVLDLPDYEDLYVDTYNGVVKRVALSISNYRLDQRFNNEADITDIGSMYKNLPNLVAAKYGEPKQRVMIPSNGMVIKYGSEALIPKIISEFYMNYDSTATGNMPSNVHIHSYAGDGTYSVEMQDAEFVQNANKVIEKCNSDFTDQVLGGLLSSAVVSGAKVLQSAVSTSAGYPKYQCATTCMMQDGSSYRSEYQTEAFTPDLAVENATREFTMTCNHAALPLGQYGEPSVVSCQPK